MLNVNVPETRGVALALQSVTDDLGRGLGPVIVAGFISRLGRQGAFNIAIAGWIPCGVLLVSLVFSMRKDEASMQQQLAAKAESALHDVEVVGTPDGCLAADSELLVGRNGIWTSTNSNSSSDSADKQVDRLSDDALRAQQAAAIVAAALASSAAATGAANGRDGSGSFSEGTASPRHLDHPAAPHSRLMMPGAEQLEGIRGISHSRKESGLHVRSRSSAVGSLSGDLLQAARPAGQYQEPDLAAACSISRLRSGSNSSGGGGGVADGHHYGSSSHARHRGGRHVGIRIRGSSNGSSPGSGEYLGKGIALGEACEAAREGCEPPPASVHLANNHMPSAESFHCCEEAAAAAAVGDARAAGQQQLGCRRATW